MTENIPGGRRRYLTLALALLAATIGSLVLVATTSHSRAGIETASDIGVLFASKDRTVEYVDFAPEVSREEAVQIARAKLENTFPAHVFAGATMRASVARYSGMDQRVDTAITGREVWAVVFDDIDYVSPGGPQGSNKRPGDPQYNVIIDAHTGEIIFSVVSGRLVPVDG